MRRCFYGRRIKDSAISTIALLIGLARFSSLPANPIITWADLEKQFHKYFFAGVHEIKITNLTAIKQSNDEPITDYI